MTLFSLYHLKTMAPCPSCKQRKKSCTEDCFIRKHISDIKDYETAHKLYGGPQTIEKVIKLCTIDTLKAVNSLDCKTLLGMLENHYPPEYQTTFFNRYRESNQ
ncbi:hypothetical protein AABB24_019461 [Solanum stoloniferum]|uniref:LOB domain-containing protein n=1 Tax=Solanum stoloniferum TaxID=62892 RepID=A0ABD2TIK5_9SOLN